MSVFSRILNEKDEKEETPKFDPIQTKIEIVQKSIELSNHLIEVETDEHAIERAKKNLEKEEQELLGLKLKHSEYFI